MNRGVSSVRPVPETGLMSYDELSADDAWPTARHHGLRALLAGAFVRFRYGDGFSHARAFAFQLALATVPLIIAGAGLATAIGARSSRSRRATATRWWPTSSTPTTRAPSGPK